MKSINYLEVIADIEVRMNFFDKNRINKKTVNETYYFEDTPSIKFVEKESKLTIVTEEHVEKDIKILDFVKSDDFFLTPEEIEAREKLKADQQIDSKKEAKQSFFKSISNFFADDEKEKKKEKLLQKPIEKAQPKSNDLPILEVEKLVSLEFEPIKSDEDIQKEIEIKAEKLRLIEEEFRIKAEKREDEERLLNEQKNADDKNTNTDFRKNKRKK